ncbi:MAG: ribosome maturation factor RimM [Flavitalea sp.]
MTNYCSIGKFVATFGVQGDLILKHHLGKKTGLKGLETLFIEVKKDELLPYFVETIKIKSDDELYVKVEGISSKESARLLVQKQVWLVEEEFHKHAGKSAPISLLGFHMIQDDEDLGEILEVIEQPHQLLCRIEWKGKEALIPIHEETLIKIDKKTKKVLVSLPDGLLDVFI